MKTTANALSYEKTPVKWRSVKSEKWDKMLLKDANLWHVGKHLSRKYTTELWAIAFFVSIAVDIWVKLGK